MELSALPREPKRVSTGRAVSIGTLWINIPVLIIIFGGMVGSGTLLLGGRSEFPPSMLPTMIFGAFLPPFLAGWLWWSFNIPKWRLWALERTDNWAAVQAAAIRAGLIWDQHTSMGRMFARTEIWTAAQRERETELRLHRGLPARGAT